ncbi:MAG: SapC family protein [Pseudomonadota bacterium]
MSDKVLFYNKIVPLNEQRHKNYCFEHKGDYSFTKETNAVFLSLMEFPKASREYPIVFAGNEENSAPFALVGLENNQNLFLSKYEKWNAEYIPAYVRRYPFVLAKSNNNYTVCIDESCKGFNQEGKGERLFDEKGEQSTYLENMLGFLNQYHIDQKRTQDFMAKLREYDLLEPMHANVELNSGVRVSLKGFFVINRDRLKKLESDKITDLIKSDALERIYTHLVSLENFNPLMERFAALDKAS